MKTKLERIAAKARGETTLKFTSLCHHVTKELVWESLNKIPTNSAAGIDGIDVTKAKETFETWIENMIQAMHRKSYKAPLVKRVWIPKPGKTEKRPLGVTCIADRALQRSVSIVLSAIYEQDFLNCSFGGRPSRGAHNALATFNEVISGRKVGWVLEADLKNFFGSLDQKWLLKFVKHRVEDPRILKLIQGWLKAGVLENNEVHINDVGTQQGGPASVLLSNIYLHYVLDLWFEKVVKPKMKGEVYLLRYLDDFLVCFQHHSDAINFQKALQNRLEKFSLKLEPNKTRLVEFGRFAQSNAKEKGRKVETIYFLGFTHYCTCNRKGNFRLGRKTEKSRFKRSVSKLLGLMRQVRHYPIRKQTKEINQALNGHYAYYGFGGNSKAISKVYYITIRYWHRMLCSRSWKSYITWENFGKLIKLYPLQQPSLVLPYERIPTKVVL